MANFFTGHSRQSKQALRDLCAKPLGNLLTILVIGLSLALPATLFLLTKNVMLITEQWQAPNQITLFLVPSTEAEAQNFVRNISKWQEVGDVEYISPDEGLIELREQQGFAGAVDLLEENPLPSVVLVTPSSGSVDAMIDLAARLDMQNQVDDVRVDNDWLQRLLAIENLVLTLSFVFSGLMLAAVFLVIGNTMRLQIMNQKEAIQVMKLVGATDTFILRPYKYMGFWLAIGGAFIAWLITVLTTMLLEVGVSQLALLYDSAFRLNGLYFDEVFILFLLSGFLGYFASRIATKKHLREIEPA